MTRGWLKLHAMVDVETGIVIAYTVTCEKKIDPSQLLGLADAAVKNGFIPEKALADEAYDTFEYWNGMERRRYRSCATSGTTQSHHRNASLDPCM